MQDQRKKIALSSILLPTNSGEDDVQGQPLQYQQKELKRHWWRLLSEATASVKGDEGVGHQEGLSKPHCYPDVEEEG